MFSFLSQVRLLPANQNDLMHVIPTSHRSDLEAGTKFIRIISDLQHKTNTKMSDPRFARLKTDPRFRRIRKKDSKVVVDDRFKSLFDESKDKKGKKAVKGTLFAAQLL